MPNRRVHQQREKGYVVAMTALLLVPLMVFAAFAVDVGAWYAHADQVQRTADAAALAAVTQLPDENAAWAAALEVTTANGIRDATPTNALDFDTGPSPQMQMTIGTDQSITIDLRVDSEAYFGKPVLDSIEIERYASAQYILPVPMGSPYNVIGWGNFDYGAATPSGIQLMMGGYCINPRFGDMRAAKFLRNGGCNNWPLNNSTSLAQNYDQVSADSSYTFNTYPLNNRTVINHAAGLDRDGYWFVVDIPVAQTGQVFVEVFDAPVCRKNINEGQYGWAADQNGNGTNGERLWVGDVGPGNSTVHRWNRNPLTFSLWDATDTPLTDSDAVQIVNNARAQWEFDNSDAPYRDDASIANRCGEWETMFTIPSGQQGRWLVQVQVDETRMGGHNEAVNMFALRATSSISSSFCSTNPSDSIYRADCVGFFAREWMPVRASVETADAIFSLARIDPVHIGKNLEVSMWDPGEGMRSIQILDPGGNVLPFTWTTSDGQPSSADQPADPSASCPVSPSGPCLRVDGTGLPPVYPNSPYNWPNDADFDGRLVTLKVPLNSIAWGDGWFKVRYSRNLSAANNDLTTWGVRVTGDPVRLTE